MSRRPLLFRALLFLLLFAVGVGIAYFIIRPSSDLPIYTPAQLNPQLVDPSLRTSNTEHHILDFNLTDQDGRTVTLADTKGKVVLADFFFTTCGSICPKMSDQLERVQAAYKDDDRVLLLSHSVTPEIDSVPALKAYADLHGADPSRWRLLTGDREQIYRLARKSWFAVKDTGSGGPDDFVHTENFILADTLGRLRGFYDGTSTEDVDRAIGDIGKLLGN
ncbi:MAG: SCO family protein [Flavobacteriales bacterium]|nr:SCO family protein [Flavobacteriales bacterium]